MRANGYHKPRTVQEAAALVGSLASPQFVAGGTDVMVLLRQKKISPENLISLRNIDELRSIDSSEGLRIGSGVTHTRIANDHYIRSNYSALADAAAVVGSKQIRNVATIGGNVCNAAPSADTACPLLALDARAVVVGAQGEREVAIDDLFLGPNRLDLAPGEVLTTLVMPSFPDGTGSAYIKHTRRKAMELPLIGIATRVTIRIEGSEAGCREAFDLETIAEIIRRLHSEKVVLEEVRIAMGVVAPRPIRAKLAEQFLRSKIVSEGLFEEMGPIADSECQARDSIRCEASYRLEMVNVLTKRALIRSIERAVRPDRFAAPDRLW